MLDDAAPDVAYEGSWGTVVDDTTFYDLTSHYSTSDEAAVEATFTGTRIDWYGLKNVDLGTANVFIDGTLVAEGIDCYGTTRAPVLLFSRAALANSFHTIRVAQAAKRNPASTGTAIVHDYFFSTEGP